MFIAKTGENLSFVFSNFTEIHSFSKSWSEQIHLDFVKVSVLGNTTQGPSFWRVCEPIDFAPHFSPFASTCMHRRFLEYFFFFLRKAALRLVPLAKISPRVLLKFHAPRSLHWYLVLTECETAHACAYPASHPMNLLRKAQRENFLCFKRLGSIASTPKRRFLSSS